MKRVLPRTAPVGQVFYILRLTLRDIQPEIWRLIQIPANITLATLHQTFQVAMGWQDVQVYEFDIDGVEYGMPDPDFPNALIDARKMTLADLIEAGKRKFTYIYDDMGDNWEHDVRLEYTIPQQYGALHPVCLAGQKACPPEDCGGIYGYLDLFHALKDPIHPKHHELVAWVGPGFNPDIFDWGKANALLRRITIK